MDQAHLDRSSPTKSLSSSRRETVRDVIQARQESPKKVPAEYSKDVSDWGEFPVSRKDEVPFDEQTALTKEFGASLFYADAMSNGDVEVDMIYEDLEQRRWKNERKADRIPTQVTVEKTVTPPAKVVAPVPVKVDAVDLSFESEADQADSSLQWVVLKDGTLEMQVSPGEEVKGKNVATKSKSDPPSKTEPRGSPKKDAVTSSDNGRFVGREVPGVNYSDQQVRERKTVLENVQRKEPNRIVQGNRKMDPPAAKPNAKALAQDGGKNLEQKMLEKRIQAQRLNQSNVQEEKKENEDVGNPVILLVPKVPVQKSRTTSPAPTPSDQVGARRISSLASNVDIAQPKQLPMALKEDPIPYRSDHSFMAVPEVGEDLTSLDGSSSTHSSRIVTQVLETDEGTEMFSTFSSTYLSLQENDDDDDSDSDVFNERERPEDEESSTYIDEAEGDSFSESQVSGPSEVVQPPNYDNSKSNNSAGLRHVPVNDSRVHRPPSVSSTQTPERSPTQHVEPIVSSHEDLKREQVSQIRAAVLDRIMKVDGPKESNFPSPKRSGGQLRRIMGRSLESVEAEQQHGSLTPDVLPVVQPARRSRPLWSPYSYDTDDGDDEMATRSVVSTPGTETDASSYASSSVVRSGHGDDVSYADDTSYAQSRNLRRSGYMSDGTEDDAETTINIGSELNEMATELRVKGPAVLMDWLDLR